MERTHAAVAPHSLAGRSIELICANSSQAKGRVERAKQRLQDRLVKEMRLNNISSISEANRWVINFIDDFNRRFTRPPKYPKDLHRPSGLSPDEQDDIFAWQDLRKLSKTLTFQYDKMFYLIEPSDAKTRIAGEKVIVFEYPDGRISFRYARRELNYQVLTSWPVWIRVRSSITNALVPYCVWRSKDRMNRKRPGNVHAVKRCHAGWLSSVHLKRLGQSIRCW